MNLTERAEIRKETFYKLTNSEVAPEAPSVGGRNLLKRSQINNRGLSTFSYSESTGIYDCVAPKNSGNWGYGIAFADRFTSIPEGKTLTFSMEVKPDVDCVWNNDINNTCVGLPSNPSGNDNDDTSKRKNSDRNLRKEIWNSVWFSYTAKNPTTGYTLYDSTTNFGIVTTGLAADIHFQMRKVKAELAENATPYSQAPENLGWTMTILVPNQSNRYLWKFEYIYYSDGTIEVTDPINLSVAGQNGADGIAGKDGVGLKSTVVTYGLSTSETTQPTSWTAQVPTLTKGKYLWTKTVWTYTDNTSETGYQKTYIAKDGNNGNDGIAGKDGVGIKSTTITYASSTSGTTKPTSGWSSTIPNVSAGNFLWTKTVWTYTDNTSETGYSVAKMGETGAKGDKGDKGDKGKDGKDGVIESNGENRIFYGRGDTKKGFFKNATIGTDWNGVPYGEFDDPGWHTTSGSDRWVGVSTTEGMKLLGNAGNFPTGKWTLSHDIYVTDSITDTQYLANLVRFRRTDGTFVDPAAIEMDGSDPNFKSTRMLTNYGRRAIWNPEPDRAAYGGNPLINPLEVGWLCNQIKVSTKCVPDELGNGVSQYTIEPISSQEKNMFTPANSNIKIGTPSAWAPYTNVSGNAKDLVDYYLVNIPKSALKKTNNSSELYKVSIPFSVDEVTAINESIPAKARIHVGANLGGKAMYDGNVVSGYNSQEYTLNANGSANNYKLFKWDFRITKAVYDSLDDGRNISFFLRLQNVASCNFHMKDADCYWYQQGGGFHIPSVSTAIPKDPNRTWSAMLKVRANRNCNLKWFGFERFQNMQNVTLTTEWQTFYYNGKANGTYGAFVFYGSGIYDVSSKLIIEIAEVKICNENVPKETLKNVLLTRHWYRMSHTKEFAESHRIGLNGAISGGVTVNIPAGKKTDAKIRLRNVSLRRGDVEIPFAPAPEDIYDQNNSKVDQDQLDQVANELRDQQDRLAQELAAKALASEVSELTTQLKNLKESDLAGKADITKAVASLEKRLVNVIPLGDMAQKLQFIDSYILQGEEGMEIGNKNSGSKVMITPDRIGFFSGGTEVASFSSGQLRINNGFFADTITVGHFMTRRHPNNQYVNGTYFVK